MFGEATGDHRCIPVEPESAAKGPFGTTVANGFFPLSLLASFMDEACQIDGVVMGLNYGLNKVRFTSPVPVNSRLRARLTLVNTEPLDNQGLQITWPVTVEREGQDKPVCVDDSLARVYGGKA